MMRALEFLRRLKADRRGVTAVEFAILAPVMLYLLCGAIELGHTIFARQVLEGAMVDAARTASATLEQSEADRRTALVNSVKKQMAEFQTAPNKSISIQTTVYADFSSATPEVYTDSNNNGRYDVGEPYVDRNRNGRWDAATPKTGTMGGPGDVVAYTLTFPKRTQFDFVARSFGITDSTIRINATTVVRNEATVRSGT